MPVKFILFICLVAFSSLHAKPLPDLVFILAGQSNMEGTGKIAELPERYKKPPANVRMWDKPNKKWAALGESRRAVKLGQFGPEVGFCHAVSQHYPKHTIRIIKVAAGGTSLHTAWQKGMGMNRRLVVSYEDAMKDLAASDTAYIVKGLLWMQGESDTKKIEGMADQYQLRMEAFIKQMRGLTGRPQLPVVMGRINSLISQATKFNFPHVEIVQAHQGKVASKDPRVALVDTDKFSCLADKTHFDTQGCLDLGNAMFKAIGTFLPKQ
ncbi:MAG: sialate O-acetylesterase [Akkermansiaceae bacterium]